MSHFKAKMQQIRFLASVRLSVRLSVQMEFDTIPGMTFSLLAGVPYALHNVYLLVLLFYFSGFSPFLTLPWEIRCVRLSHQRNN